MDEIKYKPILVFYLPILSMEGFELERFRSDLEQLKQRTGYEIIYLDSYTTKVELLSVDKATVIEDVQKYIDLNFSSKEKMIQNIEKVIGME